VELQVLAVGPMELLCRPCVDCSRVTGRFCDYCFAADRMPEQTWADDQLTPFCSQCEDTHGSCKYCRQDIAARTPRTGTQHREPPGGPTGGLGSDWHRLVGLPAASAATGLGHGGGGAPTGTYDSPATTINGKPVFGPVPPPGLIEQLLAEQAAAAQHRAGSVGSAMSTRRGAGCRGPVKQRLCYFCGCGFVPAAPHKCPCRTAVYCGRGCQVHDWPSHRMMCQTYEERRSVRLIAANRKCGIAIQNRLLRFLGAQPYPKGGTGPAVVGHLDPTGTYDSTATTINGFQLLRALVRRWWGT